MTILLKKGNKKDWKNYRPISLLSNIYKLFTKVLTNRLQKGLDEHQPLEQAGFRSGYSTTDHIHALNQVKEKQQEYNKPLHFAVVYNIYSRHPFQLRKTFVTFWDYQSAYS